MTTSRMPDSVSRRAALAGLGAAALGLALTNTARPGAAQEATPDASPVAADDSVEFLWQSTGGPDPLAASPDVAIHPDGTVWVLDSGNNWVQILAPDGRFLETWGEAGSGEGQFTLIREGPGGGLAFDAAGNLYVADSYNTRIQKFDPDRAFVTAWGEFGSGDGQFVQPGGIAVDAAGNVYVADIERGDVQKFDADGGFLLTFGAPGSGPGQLDGPSYPTVDAQGNLYVAEFRNNRVSKFAPDATFITSWGTRGTGEGQFQSVNAVAVDAAGTLYLADDENRRVQVLDADGHFLFQWAGAGPSDPFGSVASVELDGQGNIYVVDIANGRVLKFRLGPPLAPTNGTPTSWPTV